MIHTKFYKRIAAPASGKSYGAVQYIINNIKHKSKRYVVCAISQDLCKDLKESIISQYPDVKIDLIISDTTPTRMRVQDKYKDYIQNSDSDVIVITHTTLLNSYGSVDATGWDIIIDELPHIVQMKAIKGTLKNDNISQWLDYKYPNDNSHYKEMVIRTGWEDTIKRELEAFDDISKGETFMSESAIHGLQGLLTGDTTILRREYIDKEDGLTKICYYFSQVYNPYILCKGFGEAIILCADFEKQLTGLVFKHKFNIVVEEKEEIQLRATSYKDPHRIKIYPLIMPPVNFTKYISGQYMDKRSGVKYPAKIYDNLVEVFEHLVDVAENIVGDNGYIYTVNKFRGEQVDKGDYPFLSERDSVKRLKYNPHGLNRFVDYNIALGLFHCNVSPQQEVLLKHLAESCGQEAEVFLKGYETSASNDPLFQLITRTSIRNYEDLQEVICIVPDHRVVKYLTDGWFKGAEVIYDHAVVLHQGTKTNSRPKKFQGLFEMNDSEAAKYNRWVKSMGLSPKEMSTVDNKHIEMVTNWITELRGEE